MLNHLKQHFGSRRTGGHGGLDIARHIGPGLLVTVGFIDPGNWASNMAAGSQFGYALLWIVTLSTIMLIVLQHNAAHLGIATGACLAEATTRFLPRFVGRTVLASAYLATIATAMAEILGGAIALQMLFGLPVRAAVRRSRLCCRAIWHRRCALRPKARRALSSLTCAMQAATASSPTPSTPSRLPQT